MQLFRNMHPSSFAIRETRDVVFDLQMSLERPEMAAVLIQHTAISIKKVVQLCLKQVCIVLFVTGIWNENSTEEGKSGCSNKLTLRLRSS